jgi:hypothetical protein
MLRFVVLYGNVGFQAARPEETLRNPAPRSTASRSIDIIKFLVAYALDERLHPGALCLTVG